MKGIPYQQATRSPDTHISHDSVMQEALEKQAARRPKSGPPKLLAVTPKAPKAGNKRRKRRRVV